MKKFSLFIFAAITWNILASAVLIPLISSQASAEKYENVTVTATSALSTWTLLDGSTAKHSNFRVYGRSGILDLQIFGGGNTYNAAAYYMTIPAGVQYSSEVYKGTVGTYVKTTSTGLTEDVEFESKRPASYWPWR